VTDNVVRTVSDSDYVALSSFLSGYLHEDFYLEHRTPDGAMGAFCLNASPGERSALRKDCERFLAATKGWPLRDVKKGMRELGGAWAPRSRAALEAVFSGVGAIIPR
jgi:hypothetical protein